MFVAIARSSPVSSPLNAVAVSFPVVGRCRVYGDLGPDDPHHYVWFYGHDDNDPAHHNYDAGRCD